MSRAARLLDLLALLRRHRRPATGQSLADELGVSLRTLYRDVESLKAQGADIQGEAGLGFVLKPGFMLPPLMFTPDEIEAVFAGALWICNRRDPALAAAAGSALSKIRAVLPEDAQFDLDRSGLLVGPSDAPPEIVVDSGPIREALRRERKLRLSYKDAAGEATDRTVWPVALGVFNNSLMLAAWCELRSDFRHFRLDRIARVSALKERMPRRRAELFEEWRCEEDLDDAVARTLY